MIWWTYLLACTGGRTDDGPPPVTVPTCADDDGCDPGLICADDGVCVPGDRDNGFDEATSMRFNEDREGLIEPAGDVDFYRFETLEDGLWVVLTTVHDREASDLDTVLRLFGADGRERAWADAYDIYGVVSTDSNLVAWLPTAGTWYVSVEDATTYYGADEARGGPDFAYTLTLGEFTVTTDEDEAPTTLELENGTSVSRRAVLVGEPGDVDEITLSVPEDGRVVQVTGGTGVVASDLTARVRVLRDGVLVAEQADLRSGTYAMILDSQAGDYQLLVDDADGDGGDDAWIVLYARTYDPGASVTFWGTADYELEAEPNDELAAAQPLNQDDAETSSGLEYEASYVEGALDLEDDEDWYRITIDTDRLTTVRCYADRVGSQADLAIELFDPSGASRATASAWADWTAPQLYNVPVDASGDWILRVHRDGSAWGPAAFYRCQWFDTDWDVAEE